MLEHFLEILNPINILDIIIVSVVIYKVMMLLKGTRAVQLLKGLAVLIIATLISNLIGFKTLNWLLEKVQTVLIIAIPIVFQPELRRGLEQLGRGNILNKKFTSMEKEDLEKLIEEIVRAVKNMSDKKIGSLIVIERKTGLEDYVETGIKIDGLLTSETLINIFIPNTPLHDGAVIVRDNRIVAASCFLPLSENPNLSKELGTRHRAGIGITEVSDSLVVFVSEETGIISLAEDGKIKRNFDEDSLREMLLLKLRTPDERNNPWWRSKD